MLLIGLKSCWSIKEDTTTKAWERNIGIASAKMLLFYAEAKVYTSKTDELAHEIRYPHFAVKQFCRTIIYGVQEIGQMAERFRLPNDTKVGEFRFCRSLYVKHLSFLRQQQTLNVLSPFWNMLNVQDQVD